MAKILVPETSSQLSLSFEGRPYRSVLQSLPDVSPKLAEQVFRRVHGLSDVFKPLNFTMVASAIKSLGLKRFYFVGRERQVIGLQQLITDIIDGQPPKAHVALNLHFEGGTVPEADSVCKILLDNLKIPWRFQQVVSLRDGRITVIVPLDPIARIDVGTLDVPPVTHSFVLREEITHLLPTLNALGRPYQVVAA
ncbi:MAG: hypothetical protein RLY47_474 [Candidatus Parcubacteria bacterium]|jgi:hypothetical protein